MIRVDQVAIDKLKKKLKEVGGPMTRSEASKLGKPTLTKMLSMIRSGSSPIEGRGKFPAYRGSYKTAIERGYLKGKKLTPVNLTLSGDFLRSLTQEVVSSSAGGFAMSIGFNDEKSQDKERGHREGANGQARRPVIPQPGRGESFVKSIRAIYIGLLRDIISKRVSKK